jgi:uncharacterized protein
MKHAVALFLIFGFPLCGQDLTGLWLGALKAGPGTLRIALHINQAPGGLTGTMDSLDQGASGIPMSNVSRRGNTVKFEVPAAMGSYEGTLSQDGTEISGTWTQHGASLPLTFKRTGKLPEFKRPREPKRPFPYDEEEITYENRKAGVKFAGTLTLPRSAGPHPAVLLITGSGPQNRDEELLGHKPFLILADHLTRQGIAVARVDDRGVGGSTGKETQATTEDFVADVLAGVAFLKTRKEINPRRIGLIGHSEGGLIAPMAAAQSSDVAFIVMMAGPGVRGDKLLEVQAYKVPISSGASEKMAAANREISRLMVQAVESEKEEAAVLKRFREGADKLMAGWEESRRKQAAPVIKAAEGQLKMVSSPWFRTFLALDPRPILMKVKVPVLAINGELDTQVDARQNLPAILEALEAGGNSDYTIAKLPGLNHLFQTAKTGSPVEYQQIEETMSPLALTVMAEWIRRQTAR